MFFFFRYFFKFTNTILEVTKCKQSSSKENRETSILLVINDTVLKPLIRSSLNRQLVFRGKYCQEKNGQKSTIWKAQLLFLQPFYNSINRVSFQLSLMYISQFVLEGYNGCSKLRVHYFVEIFPKTNLVSSYNHHEIFRLKVCDHIVRTGTEIQPWRADLYISLSLAPQTRLSPITEAGSLLFGHRSL